MSCVCLKRFYLFVILCISAGPLAAQINPMLSRPVPDSSYDQHRVFHPGFYSTNGNSYRAADGSPGNRYWQNSADYVLHASLDDQTNSISAIEEISYTNN